MRTHAQRRCNIDASRMNPDRMTQQQQQHTTCTTRNHVQPLYTHAHTQTHQSAPTRRTTFRTLRRSTHDARRRTTTDDDARATLITAVARLSVHRWHTSAIHLHFPSQSHSCFSTHTHTNTQRKCSPSMWRKMCAYVYIESIERIVHVFAASRRQQSYSENAEQCVVSGAMATANVRRATDQFHHWTGNLVTEAVSWRFAVANIVSGMDGLDSTQMVNSLAVTRNGGIFRQRGMFNSSCTYRRRSASHPKTQSVLSVTQTNTCSI